MLVFRSLTLGLLGACVLLLAQRRDTHVHHVIETSPVVVPAPSSPSSAPTIIDIATQACQLGAEATTCFATDLGSLLALAPGERVTAVGDSRIDAVVVAALEVLAREHGADAATYERANLAELAVSSALWLAKKERGRYLDLVIEGPRGERRVLVLMH